MEKRLIDYWKDFLGFLKKDSWMSLVVTLVLAFILIKFIFFPFLSLVTGTSLPLVIVESCSMYHSTDLGNVLANRIYEDNGISPENTTDWNLKNGLSKGDIVFVLGVSEPEVGDVIIFNSDRTHPIIHRIISIDEEGITTKGDHNPSVYYFDKDITNEQLIGRAIFRIPFVGWAKLIFFEHLRPEGERGVCE